MSFYETYVRLCESVGKSPSAVAKEIGIQKSTVTHWSKGGNPSMSVKIKVADYFNVSVNYLDATDIVILTTKQQEELYNVLLSACNHAGYSSEFLVSKLNISDVFSRLKSRSMSRVHISEINSIAEELNDDSVYKYLHDISLSFENGGNEYINNALSMRLNNYSPERRNQLIKILLENDFSKSDLEFLKKYFKLSIEMTDDELRLISLYRRADEIDRQTIKNILSRYDEDGASARSSTG